MSRLATDLRECRRGLIGEFALTIAATALLLIALVAAAMYIGDTGVRLAIVAHTGFALIAGVILVALPAHPYARFGLANILTTVRAGLTVFIGALVFEADRLVAPCSALAWLATGTAAAALVLDGLDGYAARATRRGSAFGARFDMEIDALLLLLLCALLWAADKFGIWVFAIGLMRYGFVAAGLLFDRLAQELPDSRRRKTVCALQGILLCAALAPIVSAQIALALGLTALAALIYSFAVDTAALLRSRPR